MIWRIGQPVKLVRPVLRPERTGAVGVIMAMFHIPKGSVLRDGSPAPIDGDCQIRWFDGTWSSQAFWQLEPIVPEEKTQREISEVV